MRLVLRKSPRSSHRSAKTFEALGTSLIVVLGFLVSTETKMVLFSTMEKSNFAVESLFWYFSISFCSYNHNFFYREVNFLTRQIWLLNPLVISKINIKLKFLNIKPISHILGTHCGFNFLIINLLSSYLPVQWNDVKFIWNNSYLYCGNRSTNMNRSANMNYFI